LQLLLTLAFTFLFIFLIGKLKFFRLPGISMNWIYSGFLLKLLAGISVGLIYTYYYTDRLTADTFKFFDDSKILYDALKEHPSDYLKMLTGIGAGDPSLQHYYDTMKNWYDIFSPFNDNRTLIRLNALIRLFSFGFYYVHVAVVCFLSFIGIIAIVKVFLREYPGLIKEIYLVFLLLPSVLFWGSGLLKDSLVFFTLGITLLIFDQFVHSSGRRKFHRMLFLCLAFFFLMMTKFQVFLIILPLLLSWYIVKQYRLNALAVFTGVSLTFFTGIYMLQYILPDVDIPGLLVRKQQAFFSLAESADAGSLISIPELKPSFLNFAINAPVGFFTCLVRPFITDSGALLNTISAIENTLILVLAIVCVSKFRKGNVSGKTIPVFCLFYAVYSYSLIGMVTPVLGAIVRYKAQALPFMVVLLIIISHPFIYKLAGRLIPKTTN
jgi:hypothetical protein